MVFLLVLCGLTSLAAESLADAPRPPDEVTDTHRNRFVRWFQSAPGPSRANVRSPGPDLANFPNASFTLPRWRAYLETTPLNLASGTSITPLNYDWEIFLRLGLTDNIEARVYSGGLTIYGGGETRRVGFAPITFDTKIHLAQHSWRYFNFSLGLEAYVQTPWGSSGFANGVQYSLNLLADHELPWKLTYEWNLGFLRTLTESGQQVFVPTFQAALQRPVIGDLAIFLQSYRNAATLPRTGISKGVVTGRERATVFGAGLQWTVNARWAVFGSFNMGFGSIAPLLSGSAGLAIAL
jgi:hypothetical protein